MARCARAGPGSSRHRTGIVAGPGQRRWKREQADSDSALYRESLRAAYLELWDIVEDAHLKMRAALGGTPSQLSGFVADVNNFMIRRGLYIERRDRFLVLEDLFWTHELLRQVAGTDMGREALLTSLTHDDMPRSINVLDEVKNRAEQLRNQLRERIREVVGAPPSERERQETKPSELALAGA
jgi:hypothetical protein